MTQSGFYDEEFDLELTSAPGTQIFYTTDNSTPSENSLKYSSPIHIADASKNENIASAVRDISVWENPYIPDYKVDKCNVIKAVAIDSDGNRSPVSAGVYFVGHAFRHKYRNVSVMSLSLDSADLFDDFKGIYVVGKQRESESQHEPNYNHRSQDWEREAALTFFDAEKNFIFSQDVNVAIHGNWTRNYVQKGFNIFPRNSSHFRYNFFGDGTKLNTFMLRCGGEDYNAKLRDILHQKLLAHRNIATQDSKPCVLFLNGEYWGLYNLQERFTKNYLTRHYGIDGDNVITVKIDAIDIGRGKTKYNQVYKDTKNFFMGNDFFDDANYEQAGEYIDIQSFIEYMAAEIYIGNLDWPMNNFRMWRAGKISSHEYEDGKWRFMLYDTESNGFEQGKAAVSIDSYQTEIRWDKSASPIKGSTFCGLVFSKLLQNQNFRERFKKTFFEMAENDFAYERVHKILYDLAAIYAEPMREFYHRFVSASPSYDEKNFYEQVALIDDFFKNRSNYICNYTLEHLAHDIESAPAKVSFLRECWRFIKRNFKMLSGLAAVTLIFVMLNSLKQEAND